MVLNPYVPEGFFGKGKFHVLEAPEKSKNDMEVLRPVLSTSRRGAFNAVEKKTIKKKNIGSHFLVEKYVILSQKLKK